MLYIDQRVLAFFQGYTDLIYHKYGLSKPILVTVMMVLYFAINIYLCIFSGKDYCYGIFFMAALIGIMVSRLQLSRRLDLDDSTRIFSIFLFICGFIYILIMDKSINSMLDAFFMMLYIISIVYILSTKDHIKKKKFGIQNLHSEYSTH
jgi:uncharacterized protein YebE (UPF0316 family)